MKLKKNKPFLFDSAKEKMPTRLGEIITDGLPTLVLWNFLFILTCIPILTIGPAMAAMSFCTNALVMDEQPKKRAAALYLNAFKASFAKAFPLGICFLLVSISFGTGFFVYFQLMAQNMAYIFLASISLLVLLLFWGVTAHLFPMMFDMEQTDWKLKKPVLVRNPLRQLISEAKISALTRMIPTTIGLIFSVLCLGFMTLYMPTTFPLVLTLAFSTVGVAMALAHTKSPY